MTFELPLTETRIKPHQVTALHLLVALAMTGIGAVLRSFYAPAKNWSLVLLVAGILLLILALFRNRWLTKPAISRMFRIGELMVMLCLASFFVIQHWKVPAAMCGILSFATLFSIFWENEKGSTQVVRIDDNGVNLPMTSRRRHIDWRDIDQVLFRHGTLTINCYDNRLFQWMIGNVQLDRDSFENFCLQQIEAGKLKRDKNDW